MTPLNFSAALLTALATVVIAHPAAAATSRPVGIAHKLHAQPGDGGPGVQRSGADGADRQPFSIRFPGFLPVDYLQFAPKQEGEPEFFLTTAPATSAPIDEAHQTPKGLSEPNHRSQGQAQIVKGPAISSASVNSRDAKGKAASAEGRRHESGEDGEKGDKKIHGKRGKKGADKSDEEGAAANDPSPSNDEGDGSEVLAASPAAPDGPVTPVPEPTTALFGAAVLGVCGLTRRRPRHAPTVR